MTPGSYRVCNEPGCGALVPAGAGKCNRHRSEARARSDAKRPTATQRGYGSTTGWPATRRRYLAAHPTCEMLGCSSPASHADHIRGLGPFGPNEDDELQALCASCHSRKTATHDGGFGR